MKKINIKRHTYLNVNTGVEGETIETKVERIVTNSEPITDTAPKMYTLREEGVKPETDIRTDRFDLAIDAMTIVSKTHTAKRMERLENKKIAENLAKGLDKDGKPIQGTEGTQTA